MKEINQIVRKYQRINKSIRKLFYSIKSAVMEVKIDDIKKVEEDDCEI
jgi:hypothetical protein